VADRMIHGEAADALDLRGGPPQGGDLGRGEAVEGAVLPPRRGGAGGIGEAHAARPLQPLRGRGQGQAFHVAAGVMLRAILMAAMLPGPVIDAEAGAVSVARSFSGCRHVHRPSPGVAAKPAAAASPHHGADRHRAFLSHTTCWPAAAVPERRAEFGASFAELGLAVALMSGTTALLQTPVGFAVDRRGARPFLIGGTLLMALSVSAMAAAPGIWAIWALAILSGVGNSVIHPADYAILAGSIDKSRMGRAFAMHTFTGNLGFALAPPVNRCLRRRRWRAAA